VINQTAGPGSASDFLYFMRVLFFIAFLSMGYTLGQPKPASNKNPALLLPDNANPDSPEQEWTGLPPWQKKASEQAVKRYAAAQEKKWRRWNESMFERS
jgi:hypothetical protein